MSLNKNQKDFIENKVKSLGNIEKVQQFHKKKSLVYKYAHKFAIKLYSKQKLKRRRK